MAESSCQHELIHCCNGVLTPDCLFNLVEAAKLESNINGALAGFSMAIAIVLITSSVQNSSGKENINPLMEGSVSVFVTATFTSILAAYLFSSVGSTWEHNQIRAHLLLFSAGIPFIISATLFMFGILLALDNFKFVSARNVSWFVLWFLIFIIMFRVIASSVAVVAIMNSKIAWDIWTDYHKLLSISIGLLGFPLVSVIIRSLVKFGIYENCWICRFSKWPDNGGNVIYNFLIYSALLCLVCAIVPRFFIDDIPIAVQWWHLLFYIFGYSLNVGWLILIIPSSRNNNHIKYRRSNKEDIENTVNEESIMLSDEKICCTTAISRAKESFSGFYFTAISIIQGVALGKLGDQFYTKISSEHGEFFDVIPYFLVSFFVLFIVQYEITGMATYFKWVPQFVDSLIPLALGFLEFGQCLLIGNSAWWLVSTFLFIVGAFGFWNSLSHCRDSDYADTEMCKYDRDNLMKSSVIALILALAMFLEWLYFPIFEYHILFMVIISLIGFAVWRIYVTDLLRVCLENSTSIADQCHDYSSRYLYLPRSNQNVAGGDGPEECSVAARPFYKSQPNRRGFSRARKSGGCSGRFSLWDGDQKASGGDGPEERGLAARLGHLQRTNGNPPRRTGKKRRGGSLPARRCCHRRSGVCSVSPQPKAVSV